MPISFDASSNSGTLALIIKGTVSHTVGAGLNKGLLVAVSQLRNNTGNGSATLGTVTYNGVAMTKAVAGSSLIAPICQAEIWYLTNPAAGANNLVLSYTGTNDFVSFGGLSFSGVDQSNPLDANGGTAGTSAATSLVNLTTIANNAMIVDSIYNKASGTLPPGAGQTAIYDDWPNGGSATGDNADASYKLLAVAGTTSMSWTPGIADDYAMVTASFKPSPAGTYLKQTTGTAVLGLGSTSTSWAANTTTGNLIVVGVALTNAAVIGTVSSITDNQSNTYVKAANGNITSLGDVLNAELWYAKNITGGAGSVTVSHTIDNCSMFAREYSGFSTLDQVGSASGSSSTPNSGTKTTVQSGVELVVIATGDDKGVTQTWTPTNQYGDMVGTATTITGMSMENIITTVTGAQTGTLTLGASANWDSLMATFFLPSAFLPRMMLMGVG